VLIVEDEIFLRMSMTDLFEDEGFEVVAAENAADAITILETRADVRLVVTDIQMPGSMDGLKLAAAIRHRWPPIELIVISGQVKPTPADLPARVEFLAKPYSADRLLTLAHRCLKSS
jgi:DNA-binding NtrC family response regulator